MQVSMHLNIFKNKKWHIYIEYLPWMGPAGLEVALGESVEGVISECEDLRH